MSLNEYFACVSCLSPREDRRYAGMLLVAHLFAVSTSSPHWVTDVTTNGQKMDVRVSSVDI